MASKSDNDIARLNKLIEATFDSAEGYRDAGDAAEASRFASLFRQRARERRDIAHQLQAEVQRLGGKPEEEGTVLAAAERWFANLKNSVMGSDESIVAEVESGEDHVKSEYEVALRDNTLSPEVSALVNRAYTTIKSGHDQMSTLKHEQQARKAG